MPENTASVATQTSGTPLDNLREYAERSFLAVIDMREVRDQFWSHILSCIKMPRGGVNGGGSMHCETEFIAGSEEIVKFLMEDLPLMPNKRYNQSLPPPHWEESPSISTYSALTNHMIDSYFRLHRRNAARGYRGYRGSALAAAPDTHPAPVCLLTVSPPFLVELCHRRHGKLVLAVSFNLSVLNDQNLPTYSPCVNLAMGMDIIIHERMRNHLTKMRARHLIMSDAFIQLAEAHTSTLSESEGEWVPPPPDNTLLNLPPPSEMLPEIGGDDDDTEEAAMMNAVADTSRPRGEGTRWGGKLRRP
jgi:hypothetical protein